MVINIQIGVSGSRKTLARLKAMGVELNDFSDEFKQMGAELVDFFSGPVFDTEGGITGARWANLKPEYEWLKRRMWPGRGILEASGQLRRSFRYFASKTLLKIDNVRMPLFAFHQRGTIKMPARAMFRFNNTLLEKIFLIIKNGLKRKIQRAMK